MNFKKDKWYNFGDVNHRLYGGIFIKYVTPPKDFETLGDTMEVVSINNNEDYGGKGYALDVRSDRVADLIAAWESFEKGEHSPIANSMYWEPLKDMDPDERIFLLAADMMGYYGGECEAMIGTNYWKLLRTEGIHTHSIS